MCDGVPLTGSTSLWLNRNFHPEGQLLLRRTHMTRPVQATAGAMAWGTLYNGTERTAPVRIVAEVGPHQMTGLSGETGGSVSTTFAVLLCEMKPPFQEGPKLRLDVHCLS